MEPERSRLPAALPVPVAPKLPCGKLAVEVLACELGDARGLGRRRLLLTTTARPLLLLLLLLPAVEVGAGDVDRLAGRQRRLPP